MNYAAAVADHNNCYFDDTRPDGIIAPPMMAVALTWKISSRFHEFWRGTDFPVDVLRQQVHYLEQLEWRRMLRSGDTLWLEGECKAILPHRAGCLLLIEYRAIDGQGELVFAERIGGLLRGVTCEGEGRGQDNVPVLHRYRAEGPVWEKKVHIGPAAAHLYDGCADIHFPIHTSVAFARSVGLPDIIYHGTATLSQALRDLVNREAGRDPRHLLEVRCNFGAMVMLDSTITLQMLGREVVRGETLLHFQVLNEEGQKAIRQGTVRISPPGNLKPGKD